MYIRLSRSCKRSRNCVQLLAQLQLLSATANAISSHLATATASCIKPTTASATANDGLQPSTTATAAHKSSTTATASANGDFRPGTTASTTANDGLRQQQLQLRLQLHTPVSQLHTTVCNCQFQTSQTIESSIFCYI